MSKHHAVLYLMIGAIFVCMCQPEPAGASQAEAEEITQYVEGVLTHEAEFALKSPANKHLKEKGVRKGRYRCTEGHWVTIDDRPVFICD